MEYISKLLNLTKKYKETSLIVIIFNVKGRTCVKDNYDNGDSLDAEYYSTSQCDNIVMTLRRNNYNVKCYFNELDFIHDHSLGLLKNTYPLELIVINFGQIGRSVGRKSLIPAYCDINDIVHTNSNALSVSLAREKYFWSKILDNFTEHNCKAWYYSG